MTTGRLLTDITLIQISQSSQSHSIHCSRPKLAALILTCNNSISDTCCSSSQSMSKSVQCAKYQYVVTSAGPKILPVDEAPCKDEESPAEYNAGGYLPIHVSDNFSDSRYRVVRKLGYAAHCFAHASTHVLSVGATFQRCGSSKTRSELHGHQLFFRCAKKSPRLGCHSALKVVKSAGRYAETARDEIKLLSQVSAAAPFHPGREHIVSFLDSFTHNGPESSHICIVFEPLGENLLGLIDRNKKTGVPATLVKIIARQVLLGLQYLHDECDLVHTDIKPENIRQRSLFEHLLSRTDMFTVISIPDVEAHIFEELNHSPSPTSRRVGVPPPTKSRIGVSIPHNRQGARRQVQIWESQPLSSPISRSPGPSGHSFRTLTTNGGSGSTPSSQGGSYVSPSQMVKLAASQSNGVAGSIGSNSSIPVSGLSMTAPHKNGKGSAFKSLNAISPSHSTSSSSSSISSNLTSSKTLSSSTISTPPTSLPHSMGSAVAGLMKMSLTGGNQSPVIMSTEPIGVPLKTATRNKILESGPEDTSPSSWKEVIGSPVSWKGRLGHHFASSSPKDAQKDNQRKPTRHSMSGSGHSRTGSGMVVSSSWKDPGTSAPAPALVVSATARPQGSADSGDYFDFSRVNSSSGPGGDFTFHSQSSSSTVTETWSPSLKTPVPAGTAVPPTPRGPSLLTRTAPVHLNPQTPPLSRSLAARQSPPKHVSQLSAHMHAHPPPDYVTPPLEETLSLGSVSNASTSASTHPDTRLDFIPSSLTLSRPVSLSSQETDQPESSIAAQQNSKPDLPPIDAPPVPLPPLISVKIADLGNATPSSKHFTEDIQTRQYRSPEAIVGRKDWDTRADIWSVACVVRCLFANVL